MLSLLRIYHALPIMLQHAAVTAFGWQWQRKRFGGRFAAYCQAYQARQNHTAAQWRAHQTKALREALHLAMNCVPYYQRAYAHLDLSPDTIRTFTLDDLARLPIVDKSAVRQHPLDFCPHGKIPAGATLCATSGSTGTPVNTWWTRDMFQRSLALREVRAAHVANVSYASPRATIGGRRVISADDWRGPFYRYNACERQVYFSAYHLNATTAPAYVQALHTHRIAWITGYTHVIVALAKHMRTLGLSPPATLKAIITTSEPLCTAERDLIGRVFGCTVLQEYGCVEDCFFACEDQHGHMRLSPDAGIVEIVDDRDQPEVHGSEGQVIATGFICQSPLLIRYRTGDTAAYAREMQSSPPTCKLPILRNVIGRTEDLIIGPHGQKTARLHQAFVDLPEVHEAQVIQDEVDHLLVWVVCPEGLHEGTTQAIIQRIHASLSSAMRVDVCRVPAIARTSQGKFRAVRNLVDPQCTAETGRNECIQNSPSAPIPSAPITRV